MSRWLHYYDNCFFPPHPSKFLLTFNWQPAAQMTETKTDGSTVFLISVMMALFCFRLYWCLVHITFILPSRLSIFPKLMWPFCDISWHPRALGNFLCVHLFGLVTGGVLQLSPWHLDHSIPFVVTLQYLMRDSWGWNAHPSVFSTIHFESLHFAVQGHRLVNFPACTWVFQCSIYKTNKICYRR